MLRASLQKLKASMSTILLVDDTVVLQEVIVEMLRDLGHTVLPADGGEEALRIAAEYEGLIDILLTDIFMPRMSGPELAARIGATRAGIRVVFMSGSGPEARETPGVIAAGGVVLEKPFARDQLEQALSLQQSR
jgi:two-component system cell cycle sensor histidine kinase/response regulator CckA